MGHNYRSSSKAGWSWGCVSAIDTNGRTIWIADGHRDQGKRFSVHVEEKLTAFLELERIAHELALLALLGDDLIEISRHTAEVPTSRNPHRRRFLFREIKYEGQK